MGPFANRMGAVASPIIAGTSLVLVLDQFEGSSIVALAFATGAVQWQVAAHGVRRVDDARPLRRRRGSRPRSSPPAAARSAGTPSRAEPGSGRHAGMAPTMVASPVVTGDTVVGFGYGYDATRRSPRR